MSKKQFKSFQQQIRNAINNKHLQMEYQRPLQDFGMPVRGIQAPMQSPTMLVTHNSFDSPITCAQKNL